MSDNKCPDCGNNLSKFNGTTYCELCSLEFAVEYNDDDGDFEYDDGPTQDVEYSEDKWDGYFS